MSITLTIQDTETVGGVVVTNKKVLTEIDISDPLSIQDVEGKSQNTTLSGDVYVDYVYRKKNIKFKIFNLSDSDYNEIRGFYTRQFENNRFPTISITELNITNMVAFMTMDNRNINDQCLTTNTLELNFRETVQP